MARDGRHVFVTAYSGFGQAVPQVAWFGRSRNVVEDNKSRVPPFEADGPSISSEVEKAVEGTNASSSAEAKPKGRTRRSNLPEVRPEDRIAVSVEEAAQLLDLDPRTIRDMVARGELEGNKAGRVIRVCRASLLEWVRGKRSVPGSRRSR